MTVLIAGGGVAGAAAACLLGPSATLIEREAAAHDKICGEFISWEAQDALAQLGIDVRALGGAEIGAVRLVHDGRIVRADLPQSGIGLSRRVLDEALLRRAAASGARVLRGHTVRGVSNEGLAVVGLGVLPGTRILWATGKHDVRGLKRRTAPGDMVGFKMYFQLAPDQQAELAGHVEVVLFRGGYAGLQMVEGGKANLCLLLRRQTFDALGATWNGVLAALDTSHLGTRLQGARAILERPVTIARVPYGFVHRTRPGDGPGVLRLGDQMAVIPSFAGDGIAIALHTAFAAASGEAAEGYHRRMHTDLSRQVRRAMLLHRMGQSLPGLVALAARAWPGGLAWVAEQTRVTAPRRVFGLEWRHGGPGFEAGGPHGQAALCDR